MADISAIFNFIMRQPIQMLIGGGILLIILGEMFKSSSVLATAGAQMVTFGAMFVGAGIVALLIYLFLRYR